MSWHLCAHDDVAGYDIIGDIHGCASMLEALLKKLGYRKQGGYYCHPERQVIFLGDLLDRGAEVRQTVSMVRDMVENGAAKMVLGNHEYTAITFATPAPEHFDRPFLKLHTSRIKRMLDQTLKQYAHNAEEWQSTIDWFRTLPLYLDFENFRVVHACWDEEKIADFHSLCPENSLQNDDFLINSVQPGTTENRIVERLLKGTDIPLPDGIMVKGADGYTRTRFRTKFWKATPKTYADVVFQPDRIPNHLLKKKLTKVERERLINYGVAEKPLFVGHYWRNGEPRLIRENIVCLDYGAVNHGKLVSYRIDLQDKMLKEDRLIWISA